MKRDHDYYRKTFDEITDKRFYDCVFHSYAALVSKEPINGQRMWKPYYGGHFDGEIYELIEDMWDHEHCSICSYKIEDGQSYWVNEKRVRILCDECYEYYKSA